jgi:hypothetical protein
MPKKNLVAPANQPKITSFFTQPVTPIVNEVVRTVRPLIEKTKSDIMSGIKTSFDFTNKLFTNSKQREDALKELIMTSQVKNGVSNNVSRVIVKTTVNNETSYQTVNDQFISRLNERVFGEVKDRHSGDVKKSDQVYENVVSQGSGVLEFSSINYSESSNYVDNGAFFKYYSKFPMDLSRYGIFEDFEQSNYENTCLVDALLNSGLSDEKYTTLVNSLKSREIPICKLPEICEMLSIQINLKKQSDKEHVKKYGSSDEVYNIGLIDNHFFINEKIDITSFAAKNALEICHLKGWQFFYKIRDGKYKSDLTRNITSFDLIMLLMQNKDKYLTKIGIEDIGLASTQFYEKIDLKIENLVDVDDKMIRKVKYINRDRCGIMNVFFDFETYTNAEKIHVPYLCRYVNDKCSKVFEGINCGKMMLKDIVDNIPDKETCKGVRLIAHNAGYDFNFIVRHLFRVSCIYRGSHLIAASGFYTSYRNHEKLTFKIDIKDSYNMISSPLRDFSGMFGLPFTKEVMPYDLYNTPGIIQQRYINIDYALTFVKENDKKQFLDNIEKWNFEKDGKYDIIEYSSKYCEIDCDVLRSGYNKFREWMLTITELDIDSYLTLASMGDNFLIKEGCYEDVFSLGGIPQRFIQGAVVGGRTMCCRNEMQIFNSEVDQSGNVRRMQDFDGVSLYPSAMYRMEGFLKGVPKVIKDLDFQSIKNYDGYFVDILITKIGIHRDFPLASFKTEEGIRDFTNDLIGKEIRVDKTSLEDLIEFQHVEFKVLRGYYFDEGFNTQIGNIISNLFEERAKMKKEANKIEVVYKLLLNSTYGKTIMKPITERLDIVDGREQFEKFVYRKYSWIKDVVQISDSKKYKIKSIKPTDSHFSRPHVGSMVLSWSKRIMNEVMCLAEDIGIKLYYQDTDSMHLEESYIPVLEKAYLEKYDRQLIGKKLGQFHSDFEMRLYDDQGNKKKFDDVHAVNSIFLGKKSYIDVLQGKNIKTGEIETDYHIRMKGIPNSTIKYVCEKYNKTPFELYKLHYDGNVIDYDLTENGKRANFKTSSSFSISTLDWFTRYITFDKDVRNAFNKYKDEVNAKGEIVDVMKFNEAMLSRGIHPPCPRGLGFAH